MTSPTPDASSPPIAVAINGAVGRMGREIAALVLADPALRLAAAINGPANWGKPYASFVPNADPSLLVTKELPDGIDVAIDFSAAAATLPFAKQCAAKGTALAIGTTGLADADVAALRELATKIPIVLASNMSFGVNLLNALVAKVTKLMPAEFDIELLEWHHRMKADSPSGTARTLLETMLAASGRDPAADVMHGREGMVGAKPLREIGVHAVRGGDTVGTHTIEYSGPGEQLILTSDVRRRSARPFPARRTTPPPG
jgi:4-hydroxy-tetrahydrodipicolinate reductase